MYHLITIQTIEDIFIVGLISNLDPHENPDRILAPVEEWIYDQELEAGDFEINLDTSASHKFELDDQVDTWIQGEMLR